MPQGAKLPFPSFPEFTELKLEHKDVYNEFASQFPDTIQYSFHPLLSWWGIIHKCMVSQLNGNLVFSFWVPGMEDVSGLGLLGVSKIDETICEIFDYQKKQGDEPRLVHVPDFVIEQITYSDIFRFEGERDFDEYIVSLKNFSDISKLSTPRRSALRRLMAGFEESHIEVMPIDMGMPVNKSLLIDAIKAWEPVGRLNDYAKYEKEGLLYTLKNSDFFDQECIGLYINGRLQAFFLFESDDGKRVNLGYLRLSYEYPHIVDLTILKFATWLVDQGYITINLDSDFGLDLLRSLKLSLGATTFRRFYTVRPAKEFKPS